MTRPEDSSTIAAVDLGSNSFHLVIGRNTEESLILLDTLREPVRLAAGLREDGTLDEAAAERALNCLTLFGQRLRDISRRHIRVVGTYTLRQADAAGDFLSCARKALGAPIEIISGHEEARLIYLGVAHDIAEGDGRRLVVDIGGGSTECIVGQWREPLIASSLTMGCVTYSQRFFPDGQMSAKRFKRARTAARLELEAVEARLRGAGWNECIGSSGTIKALHEIQQQSGWGAGALRREGLQRIEEHLIGRGSVAELSLPGLKKDRAPVLPGGLAVLQAVFEALDIERMLSSQAALREGLLHDLRARLRKQGIRDRTVRTLAERYSVDADQARRIEATAHDCFDQVRKAWELDEELGRDLLSWAAQLHEIGLTIAHSGYHKHGAYILANSDMPGFSREDQGLLAAMVREQRRKLTPSQFANLIPAQREVGIQLCMLLRIAIRLHRSRSPRPLPAFKLRAEGPALELRFPKGWLAEHPLTAADLEQEATQLALTPFEIAVS